MATGAFRKVLFDKKSNDNVVAGEVWPFVLNGKCTFERVRLNAFHYPKINDRIMKSKKCCTATMPTTCRNFLPNHEKNALTR